MTFDQIKLAILLPLISVISVAVIGGVIGVIFIALAKAGAHEWGAVMVGMAFVILVPSVAFLLQNYFDKETVN